MPVVSGNVSLYNETDGAGILPTPTIGAVGLLKHISDIIPTAPADGTEAVLLGETGGHLGASALMAELAGDEGGEAPEVDLDAERRTGELVLALRDAGLLGAAHDLADGGLALALAEMALAGDTGFEIEAGDLAQLFGEDQARYVVAVAPENLDAVLARAGEAGVPAARLGRFGGDALRIGGEALPLDRARALHAQGLQRILS